MEIIRCARVFEIMNDGRNEHGKEFVISQPILVIRIKKTSSIEEEEEEEDRRDKAGQIALGR